MYLRCSFALRAKHRFPALRFEQIVAGKHRDQIRTMWGIQGETSGSLWTLHSDGWPWLPWL